MFERFLSSLKKFLRFSEISGPIPLILLKSSKFAEIKSSNVLKFSEIILADSSSSSQIEHNITDLELSVPIRYLRVGRAYKYDRLLYRLFSFSSLSFFKNRFPKGRAFPYEATNAGASIARYKWIAFLDGSTIPSKDWLKDYYELISKKISENYKIKELNIDEQLEGSLLFSVNRLEREIGLARSEFTEESERIKELLREKSSLVKALEGFFS